MNKEEITLIGAGLAGSLLSVYLSKRGFKVNLYERRPDMRKTSMSAGRSINLALSTRGIHALKEVGLYEDIMKIAIPMKGRMMHALDGKLTFVPYGKDDTEVIHSVSRGELNMRLMDLAERQGGVNIHFNKRCTGMDFNSGEVHFFDEERKENFSIGSSIAIGTDGSASAIRMDMLKTGRFNFSQQYLEHGYKELTIPPGPVGQFVLEKNALHIWPRKTYMLIALPNRDGSFTCTLFFPMEGEPSFASLDSESKLTAFFRENFPDVLPLMPTLIADFFANPTGTLMTVKCAPWSVNGRALLLGDAAHAIVPFFGQGMNCSFEDCSVLNECFGKGDDWTSIFQKFEHLRKINSDAIADLAVENFYEMRDRVSDPRFLLHKKIEQVLEKKFPERFIPKYGMVTFHRMPYATALERGNIQEGILSELSAGIDEVNNVNLEKASMLIQERLSPIK